MIEQVRKHQFIYIFVALSLIGILGFSYFSRKRSRIPVCQSSKFIATKGQKYYAYPEKIVIQPWRGQHHVYAVFAVPNQYKTDYVMQVTLPDNDTDCGTIHNIPSANSEGVQTPPGHYLVKGYLNTRVALWLIAQGKVGELQQPTNWKLGYGEKIPKKRKKAALGIDWGLGR
ncbi:hypothetical protein H6G35_30850 [Aulosira sp. FACHB-113]|nr:hypothetical protein [Aulosira sp. FACHB-113]